VVKNQNRCARLAFQFVKTCDHFSHSLRIGAIQGDCWVYSALALMHLGFMMDGTAFSIASHLGPLVDDVRAHAETMATDRKRALEDRHVP